MRRLMRAQLIDLLGAQERLDAAHRAQTVAMYGKPPREITYLDAAAWRRDQKVKTTIEVTEATKYMHDCLMKHRVSENEWRRKLRKVAMEECGT